MIDASPFFLCYTSNPCELNRSKQTARCCLPNNIRPSWSAHQTARIAQPSHATRKPPKAHAPLILTLMQKKPVRKPLRRNRGGRPRRAVVRLRRSGRASGSALRSSPMAGIPVPVSVRTRIRVHLCSVYAACRRSQSNCNDNPHTLGNAMSQKEEVATNNAEAQVRYIHWATNL